MITALDTNILLDILATDSTHGSISERTLLAARAAGRLIICEVVYAELSARFEKQVELDHILEDMDVLLVRSSKDALHAAGVAWRTYIDEGRAQFECPACGKRQRFSCVRCAAAVTRRQRVVADFAVGAHALYHADLLVTRDQRNLTRYFPALRIV